MMFLLSITLSASVHFHQGKSFTECFTCLQMRALSVPLFYSITILGISNGIFFNQEFSLQFKDFLAKNFKWHQLPKKQMEA